MKYYHAHIYFEANDLNQAYRLFETTKTMNFFTKVKFHEKPVGPHPTGMVELHFTESCYASVESWVKTNCGTLIAMIHQDTRDDLKDHTEHIHWLDKKLPLDFSFFELIKTRPDLRINP